MKKENSLFNFVYYTDEDERKLREKQISNLTEDKKTDYIFNGENFYELGRGHAFLFGFFTECITKSGIKAWRYDSGKWTIDGHDFTYDHEKNEFIKTPEPVVSNEPIDWGNIKFPVVKNLSGPMADKFPSVQPILNNINKKSNVQKKKRR